MAELQVIESGKVVQLASRRRESVYERADRRRKRREPPEIPSRDDVKQLLALLKKRADATRDHPLFLLALETGMRAGTLVGLQVGDLRGPDGRCRKHVRLRPEVCKARMNYTVPLRRAIREVLDVYLVERGGSRKEPLFPSRKHGFLTVRAVEYRWEYWQSEAKWERHFRLHACRHYACTRLAERLPAFMVRAAAGHASIATTQRYVNHVSADALLDAIEGAFGDKE